MRFLIGSSSLPGVLSEKKLMHRFVTHVTPSSLQGFKGLFKETTGYRRFGANYYLRRRCHDIQTIAKPSLLK